MSLKAKKYFILILCISVFIILIGRLYKLQIIDQWEYGKESQKNSVRKYVVSPARGLIFDKSGNILIDNTPSYTLTIVPKKFDRKLLLQIANLIDEDTTYITDILNKQIGTNRFNPTKIKRDLDFKTIAYIEENRDLLEGVDYIVEASRSYPSKVRASHVIGYSREISEEALQKQTDNYYNMGDVVGQSGLEKNYEQYLRGEKGIKLVNVDVNGRVIGDYNGGKNDIKPINGSDLFLSLDIELQEYAEKLLGQRKGAIVALDPRNGEILCLVSKPDFDLKLFTGSRKNKELQAVLLDERNPLFNRVVQTRYPPGSTWKMMMAAAGMGSGKITPTSTIACEGSFKIGDRTFGDHGAYGSISVPVALEVSSNVFFYKLSLMIGLDNYNKYAKLYGFGQKTGIDLPSEVSGLVPSEEYFNKRYGEGNWGKGHLVNLGIGQGELGVSPIQLVCYVAAMAMNGEYHQPHLVTKIKNSSTGVEVTPEYYTRNIDLPQSYYSAIRRGMYLVVNGGSGTAKNIRSGKFILSGKTGTAQNTKANNHSWFIGFAPFDEPKIAVCVLGENQGWGNEFAAPLAAAIMIRYLSNYSEDVYNELKNTGGVKD